MTGEIIKIPQLRYLKVHFYTVKFEGRKMSEFSDFWNRMYSDEKYRLDLMEINRWLKEMGNSRGAQSRYFKHEGAAHALPPFYETEKENGQYGVRLYCVRYSEACVLLLNGNLKTADKAQDCPNVKPYFDLANKIARKIDKDIADNSYGFGTGTDFFPDDYILML